MNDLLGEAIVSNSIDITKIYIWRDREIHVRICFANNCNAHIAQHLTK